VVQLHGSNGQVDYHDPLEGGALAGLLTRMLEAALLGRADELQSGGRANAIEWSDLLNREVDHIWPALRTDVEPVGVPPARLDADSVGVVVGRIQSWKGPEVLCQAVALLGRSAPQLIWIGRDHPFRRLNQSMSDHLRASYRGIWGEKITPIGELNREMTAGVQAAAKFVVVPSTWDVFNLTGAEAMRLGKVVICSEGAGVAGLIRQGENGFLFPAGDAAKLADLLAKVATLPLPERMRIGQNARETILHDLDPDRIAAQRIDRYLRLKAKRPDYRRPHLWCNSMFDASITRPSFAFLNTLPLKQIVGHALKRSLNRLRLHR
jgi:glycosyltransferase involved in cell wall biosynthesis